MTAKRIAIALAVALVLAGAAGWTYYVRTPDYSLSQLREALTEGNRLQFERYFDVDRFVRSTVDVVMAQSDDGSVGGALGSALVENAKPQLVTTWRESMLKAVEEKHAAKLFTTPTDTVPLTTASMLGGGAKIRQIANVKRNGTLASAELMVELPQLDTAFVLRLKLKRDGKDWRVSEPDNLGEYLQSVKAAQESILLKANAAVKDTIARLIKIGPLRREFTSSYYGINQYLRLSARVQNLSQDTIPELLLRIFYVGEPLDDDAVVVNTRGLTPGSTSDALNILDYNQFLDWHSRARYSDALSLEPGYVRIRRNGKDVVIAPYLSWADYLDRGPSAK